MRTSVLVALEKDIEGLNVRGDRNQFDPLRKSVQLMHARVLVGQEKFGDALPLLERISAGQPASESESAEYAQAYRLVGLCHQRLGHSDLAARALERSGETATSSDEQAAAYAAAAAAWELAGATENAIANAERAVRLAPEPESLLLLARLLLVRQQRLPPDRAGLEYLQRNDCEASRCSEIRQFAAGWQIDELEADAKLLQARDAQEIATALENVYQTARRAEEQYPNDEALLGRLIRTYQRLQKPDDADRALKQFQGVTQDAFARQMAEATLLLDRQQYAAALSCLDSLGSDISPANQFTLAKTKAQILAADGRLKEAADLLKALAKDHSDDLTITRMRLQLIDQMNDTKAREELETELLGGSDDAKSWAHAMKIERLITAATSARDAGFQEALDLLGRLETARPNWSVVHQLRGATEEKRASFMEDVEQQRQALDQAARAYEQAITLGDRTVPIYERLVKHAATVPADSRRRPISWRASIAPCRCRARCRKSRSTSP